MKHLGLLLLWCAFIAAMVFAVPESEENDYDIACYSGDALVYHKTSPAYIDAVLMAPDHVVVEDEEEGTVNILNAACVWKEP